MAHLKQINKRHEVENLVVQKCLLLQEKYIKYASLKKKKRDKWRNYKGKICNHRFLSQCNLAVVRKMYHIVVNQRAYVLLTKANHLIVRLEKNKQTNAVTILSREGKKLLS